MGLRRITDIIDTIPALGTVLNGTVTQSTADARALLYSGTSDMNSLYPPQQMYGDSNRWIYIPDSTPSLVRVTGLAQTSSTTFTVYVDRDIAGASGSTAYPITGDLLGYSYTNDGGATGTVDGVDITDGETVSKTQLAPAGSRVTFQDVVLVDATGTDFLIDETK